MLDKGLTTIREAGFTLDKRKLGLSASGARFLGTLDLAATLTADGIVTLAVGVRNSIDKTFPMAKSRTDPPASPPRFPMPTGWRHNVSLPTSHC